MWVTANYARAPLNRKIVSNHYRHHRFESHTLASALAYDNEYRKLQCEYGFRWGSDLQHLHTRFLIKHRLLQTPAATSPNPQRFPPRLNRQPQTSPTTPICYKYFNSLTGGLWPNCRFQHVCLVPNCYQGHPQREHPTAPQHDFQ